VFGCISSNLSGSNLIDSCCYVTHFRVYVTDENRKLKEVIKSMQQKEQHREKVEIT